MMVLNDSDRNEALNRDTGFPSAKTRRRISTMVVAMLRSMATYSRAHVCCTACRLCSESGSVAERPSVVVESTPLSGLLGLSGKPGVAGYEELRGDWTDVVESLFRVSVDSQVAH